MLNYGFKRTQTNKLKPNCLNSWVPSNKRADVVYTAAMPQIKTLCCSVLQLTLTFDLSV